MNYARLTITDLVYVLLGLAGLAAVHPIYVEVLNDLSPRLATGEQLLFGTLLPIALLVLLAVIYAESRSGM